MAPSRLCRQSGKQAPSGLVAHPSRREIFIEQSLVADDRNTFGDQICAILGQSRYLRNERTGQIVGYGKKLLP